MVTGTLNFIFCVLLHCVIAYANESYVDFLEYDLKYVENDLRFNSCHTLLETYASASAEFSKCLIMNAKPISVCRKCEKEHRNASEAYAVIENECDDVLLNADRLQVVGTANENNENLWSRANCENCYNVTSHELTTNCQQFFIFFNETQDCFLRFNLTTDGPNKACEKCNVSYNKLKEHYKSLSQEYDFGYLCMDIVDAMNMTRRTWNEFDCIRINNNVFVLFSLITFLCLTPVVLYLSNWISSDEVKSRIIPQKRLVATRSHAQLSSVNF